MFCDVETEDLFSARFKYFEGFEINGKYLMLVCAVYHNMTKFQLLPSTICRILFGLTVPYDKYQWL